MKVTNYDSVRVEIEFQLTMTQWSILDYVELDTAILIVFNIYMMSSDCSGFGQDIDGVISVISSKDRISTIANGTSSFYKDDAPICQYNDLEDDINQILIVLQASIERMQSNE